MALVVANRVQETTTTAGTGTITLAGASAGYQSFAVIGNGNTTYYTIVDGNNWEVGIGTYTASGTTLSRDTVLSSSASGAKITLSGNTALVFVDYPAEKAIYQDSSGNVGIGIAPTQKLTAAGVIESTTGGFKFPDGTTQTSAVSASGITYITKTGNYTAANNQGILANTTGGAFTVTLPSSPSAGAQVIVADAGNTWGTNNLTVGRNGSTIEGLAEDLICNITGVSVQLVYSGTTWEVYAQVGGAGGTGVLGVINGGTGASTLTGYVKGNGTAAFTASATISGSDISGNISGNAANVTGTVAIANGGTNATATPTAGAVAYGTGTAYAFTSAGTSGQVLTSSGSGAPTWGAAPTGVAANPRTLLTSKTIAYGVTPQRFAGSVNLSATTQMLFVADGTNYYASVYDSSTDTMGSAVSVGTVAGGLSVAKLSSTAVLIGYASGGTFSARVLSVSGTTLTANTAATVASSCTFLHGDPATLGSTYVFAMTYTAGTACKLIAATVSGTTVTLGSATTVSSAVATPNGYLPAVAYSSTTGFAVYQDNATTQLSYRGFSVSGTTITLSGTTATNGPVATNTIAYHTLSNGKVLLIHLSASNYFAYSLVSMSGTTVSLSSTSPFTILTAANAAMYSVVDGNSVLLVATTAAGTANTQSNAIVIRDNAGAIAVSSAVSLVGSASTSIIPASATTIMVSTPAASSANYSYIVSVVSNAPSIATAVNSVTQPLGFSTNLPFGTHYTSVPQNNATNYNFSIILNGGNFYTGSLAGTSGNYYRMTTEGISYSPNPSSVTTKLCAPNYIAGTAVIDTTITGGCWYATFETNTLLYRVQYA